MVAELEPQSIRNAREYVAALQAEIARMPAFKVGTAWHLDRLREIETTEQGIKIRLRLLAMSN